MRAIDQLLTDLQAGRISRRAFLSRATALGMSAALAGVVVDDPAALAQDATPAATGGQPGPAAETITFAAYNVDQAPLNMQNGDIDVYLFGLKTAGAQQLENDPNLRVVQAPASTLSLILNPAPAAEGSLNPFSLPRVRKAMQYLVDREFIARDIYQGRALPMLTNITPLEYDQLTLFTLLAATDIRHDAEYATAEIAAAMTEAGAALEGGVWAFGGKPISLKFIIRVEDERRDAGDLIRAALEGAGFQVQPLYQQFAPAILTVQTTDPSRFEWHLYTEGWSGGSPARYDDGGVNAYFAPWLGNMPGWQQVGFWQYQQPDLDALGQKLFRGQFASREERDDIYRQMVTLGLEESVRIWLVTALQSFPMTTALENVTLDLSSGPKGYFGLRGATVAGRTDIKAGNLWVWTERTTWNPVGGFSDAYSGQIAQFLNDAPAVTHPFSGLATPFRASWTVETAGPTGTLAVPADAVVWDVASKTWSPVGDGVTAVTKVTWDYRKYMQGTWHHGPAITMADVLYPIAQSYELAFDDDKVQIETALGITSRPLLESYKGYRVVDATTIEVYVDYWHFDEGSMAGYAVPSGVGTPWELLAAMDDVVFDKRQGAYSDSAAARFNVPWLSLVLERDCRTVLRSVKEFARKSTVPAGVFSVGGVELVSEADADERYAALQAWFEAHNMLVLGNGPYQLTAYDPPAQFAQIDAFRGVGYPFTAADFQYGETPRVQIAPVTPPTAALGEPIDLPVTVTGPGALQLQYLLIDPAATDPAAKALTSGASEGIDGQFMVGIGADLTATVFPGLYRLHLLASSDALAEVAEAVVDLQIGV
jgi:peptide/nickel transport system substrate-binding protein